ncbi:MAG: hypothetical protein LIO75_07740 [Lachnospiraceae bacterium]|nr:hypothetical protein [Lachnospiraceae bacterium]
MDKNISVKSLMKEIRNGEFVLNCRMPMKYTAGFPVFGMKNKKACLTIPFSFYKVTGETDRTEVYPIRYTVTVLLPEGKPAAFEDLETNPAFADVDFSEKIGYFRHESIRNLNKREYAAEEAKLYGLYDKMVAALLNGEEAGAADQKEFSELLGRLMPPSLKPQYKLLDENFYSRYLS